MNPFDAMQNLADLWSKGGKAYLTAQQGLFTGMADTMAQAAGRGDTASFQAFAPDTQGFEAARQDFAKLWSSASDLSSALTRNLKADQANPQVAAMLAKIFDPRGWLGATNEVDQTLQRMAEGPQLADLWNTERKFIAVFNAWAALRRHSLEHNKVMLEAWMRAAGAFAKMLNERANEGKALESWRAVLTLWVETANEVLLETQRSEAFLTTQRGLIKASSELRLAQQELAAFYSEMFGYPTRTELDDVHRTVTELRRELRAFKRESRAPRTAAESASGAARKAPRRGAAAQPRRRGAKPAQIGASS